MKFLHTGKRMKATSTTAGSDGSTSESHDPMIVCGSRGGRKRLLPRGIRPMDMGQTERVDESTVDPLRPLTVEDQSGRTSDDYGR
jgi:hypothetical protein